MGRQAFLIVFSALLCLILYSQWYLFRRATEFVRSRTWTPGTKRAATLFVCLFFAFMLAPYLYRLLLGRPSAVSSPWFTYGILYPFGIWSLGSFFTFLYLVSTAPIRRRLAGARETAERPEPPAEASGSKEAPAIDRRTFLRRALAGTTAAPLLFSTYGTVYARTAFETVALDVPVRGLPKELMGLRIVQITDLHAGPFISERHVARIVAKANSLDPDLVMVTGDIVHSSAAYIAPCMRALSRLRAKHGLFGCQGNHEYWVGPEEVRRAAEAIGLSILVNEGRVLSIGGSRLNLAGIDDIRLGTPDLNSALAGLAPSAPTLLLSHRPEIFPYAKQRGVDLTLSGHYHGGQVKVKIFGFPFTPVRLFTRYVEGPFRIEDSRLYVSRGLGTTGAPIRLGSRPELTLIRLVRG